MDNDASNVPPAAGGGPAEQTYPLWLSLALTDIRTAFPAVRIQIVPRRRRAAKGSDEPLPDTESSGNWTVKCLDCPGKVYLLGPGETLDIFGVHLKNKLHRERVSERERVNAAAAAS